MNKTTMADVVESPNDMQLKNGYWMPENNDLQQEISLRWKIRDVFSDAAEALYLWLMNGTRRGLAKHVTAIEQVAAEATAWGKDHAFPLTVGGNPWACLDPLHEAGILLGKIQSLQAKNKPKPLDYFILATGRDCVALAVWADAQIMWLLDKAYTSAQTTAEIAAAEAREAKANERAAWKEGQAEEAHEWARVADKKSAKAEAARRKAEIALAELKARMDEREKVRKHTRGPNIPLELKRIVGRWHEQHFHVGETMQQAYDRFSVSNEGNKPSVAKYVTGWKVYKRVVEAYQRGKRREEENARKKVNGRQKS